MARTRQPQARSLQERYCPNTGVPLRIGEVWPPRLVIHGVVAKRGPEGEGRLVVRAWIRHELPDVIGARLRALDSPAVDDQDRPLEGLVVEDASASIGPAPQLPMPPAPGDAPDTGYRPIDLHVHWTEAFATHAQRARWIRKALVLELTDGRVMRSFRWPLYLTPYAAEVPAWSASFDEHPHFRWVDGQEGPLTLDGVARSWIELPAPLAGPDVPPACWVQPAEAPPRRGAGPSEVALVPVFPVEPPPPRGLEPVGWAGGLGGDEAVPAVQALAVDSSESGGTWSTTLSYWDVSPREAPGAVALARPIELEPPTTCVWPTLLSADDHALVLYDLASRGEGPCEVVVTFRVELPERSEAVRLKYGVVRLGDREVGAWQESDVELTAAGPRSLRCTVDVGRLGEAPDGRLKLTLALTGRPARGVCRSDHLFRTANGPFTRLSRSREASGVRTPWLVIDLGTEGTCAAVAFMDGFAPRVISVSYGQGAIYPSRVYLSPALGGVYSLAESASEDALYTTLIKLGLRFGDGAHPGCPDHIAATEVARFFLKRFLLEVRERMAWFPLDQADVLVSFPPRLAAFPRFVRSLRDTFRSVLEEVVWHRDQPRRLWFREEAFLVSVPVLYRDLQLDPVGPGRSRYYWVMDFGGGTTDVCGFLVQPDAYGEEHGVSHLTYPQRLPHHLSGNDVTRAFYGALFHHLADAGVVTGADTVEAVGEDGGRFPLPVDPFPSARSTPTALRNQTALRELADALKCLDGMHQDRSVRLVAQGLGGAMLRRADGTDATLVSLLSSDASHLGELLASDLHAEVLDPAARVPIASQAMGRAVRLDPTRKASVRCVACSAENRLPLWVFASNRTFRFRCRECGEAQRVQHPDEGPLPGDGDGGAPTLTAWRDSTVQQLDVEQDGELYLQQDGRTYVLRDAETLGRWVEERRVGPDDLLSEDGIRWVALRDRPELADLLRKADVVGVDITQEVPRGQWRDMIYPEPEGAGRRERPMLGRDIRLFLAACRDALDAAVAELPDPEHTDVVVLVAGRASQFRPIAEGVHTFLPGRVVHLTNDWVRSAFGTGGQIDPSADVKTLTVNGGGLFALLQSNPETSHLLLRFDTQVMDCPVYLQSAAGERPWRLTDALDLRVGARTPLVRSVDAPASEVPGDAVEEPPPRALPVDTPLTGDLQLVVEGLPEDRGWEPWVTIARGTARRKHGRRARTLPETRLWTEDTQFVLGPLSLELEVRFHRMLPRLPLLGSAREEP